MPRIRYGDESKWRGNSLDRIDTANAIVEQYRLLGLTLTLRQLYYQFVARDLLANTQKNYDNLGMV